MDEQLTTVTFWDAVTIRIPREWQVHPQPRGHFGCYEEADTGTVWVDFRVTPFEDGDLTGPAMFADMSRASFAAEADSDSDFRTYSLAPGHDVIHVRRTGEEDGDLLFFSDWHHMHIREGGLVFCHLNFVLLMALMDEPEGRKRAAMMEGELLGANIDWDRLMVAQRGESPPKA